MENYGEMSERYIVVVHTLAQQNRCVWFLCEGPSCNLHAHRQTISSIPKFVRNTLLINSILHKMANRIRRNLSVTTITKCIYSMWLQCVVSLWCVEYV